MSEPGVCSFSFLSRLTFTTDKTLPGTFTSEYFSEPRTEGFGNRRTTNGGSSSIAFRMNNCPGKTAANDQTNKQTNKHGWLCNFISFSFSTNYSKRRKIVAKALIKKRVNSFLKKRHNIKIFNNPFTPRNITDQH